MQPASSWNWTRVTVSISNVDNHYTTNTSKIELNVYHSYVTYIKKEGRTFVSYLLFSLSFTLSQNLQFNLDIRDFSLSYH